MSLVTNITNLATRIATETKSIKTLVNGNAANLSSLTTTDKTNLVAALNEIKALADAINGDLTTAESDITSIEGNIGTLASLTTTAKTSLVAAINELDAALGAIDVSSQIEGYINDSATSSTSLWSSSKTSTEISSAVSALVDGAPALLNTLNELAAAIGDDESFATTIASQISGKANAVHSHAISDVTGLQSALDGKAGTTHSHAISDVTNLQSTLDGKASTTDIGDTTTNFVTTFEAGLA